VNKQQLPAGSTTSISPTSSFTSAATLSTSVEPQHPHTVKNPSLALESQLNVKESEPASTNNIKTDNEKQKQNPFSAPASSVSTNGDISKLLLDQSRRAKVLGSEGVWDTVSTNVKNQIDDIATQQKRNDQLISRKNQVSQWDRMLDSGKNKKLKNKSKYDEYPYNTGKNKFQEFVNYNGKFSPSERY
jgi:hypothetical protein